MFTNFSSNCVPIFFFNSSNPSSIVLSFLYTRFEVIASKESATVIILTHSSISLPLRPSGYPFPIYSFMM